LEAAVLGLPTVHQEDQREATLCFQVLLRQVAAVAQVI
jgi:hypothetical protein